MMTDTINRTIEERVRTGRLSATPERLAKANEPFQVVGEDQSQIIADWPLSRLWRTGILNGSQRDTALGMQRNQAGERLYSHWFHGRLFPLGSRDYRKPYTGSSESFAIMPQSERQAYHRDCWRKANACLGSDRTANVTRAIVLDEKEPLAVGRVITGRQHEGQARAVAIEMLLDGLDRLRQLWGMRS